ncbi:MULTISPECIES: hypothetical protein [Photorhabdus]|uniref:CdiI immunity protein domain-containing protein n=3 Tax=Photorhabdus TaxID=29487 RepID=A0ABR5KC47_9GAMM|nr:MULTISPECIES: hypothetical protein [Photorhabdus]AWK41025.1 hypothetical protein A4R40_05585 [Photorhabdus laumondii subsp. laumondii]AXG41966.1 hypothetical protein PluDJC_06585 [Photorhabdus laumondii subsp. laumondii]AXG46354.1 hypothetical protein PluTT01m_05765 [Photorhabdus laumondii subsp. laumondii]KOY62159.1 hypothetical protein AM629_10095 [Photorhabdus heterorhabditis]KOY62162.1 hypothetical protein AM629_10120 [Photorhabdus heterorhabditis]
MANNFEVDFFSDSRYEELTAEISYRGQILCQLNKDKGIDSIEIEFFSDSRILEKPIEMKFPLDEFINVLMNTKVDLIT